MRHDLFRRTDGPPPAPRRAPGAHHPPGSPPAAGDVARNRHQAGGRRRDGSGVGHASHARTSRSATPRYVTDGDGDDGESVSVVFSGEGALAWWSISGADARKHWAVAVNGSRRYRTFPPGQGTGDREGVSRDRLRSRLGRRTARSRWTCSATLCVTLASTRRTRRRRQALRGRRSPRGRKRCFQARLRVSVSPLRLTESRNTMSGQFPRTPVLSKRTSAFTCAAVPEVLELPVFHRRTDPDQPDGRRPYSVSPDTSMI